GSGALPGRRSPGGGRLSDQTAAGAGVASAGARGGAPDERLGDRRRRLRQEHAVSGRAGRRRLAVRARGPGAHAGLSRAGAGRGTGVVRSGAAADATSPGRGRTGSGAGAGGGGVAWTRRLAALTVA